MNVIGCTLFEGHYHYGLAALINSLSNNGFRGDFYAGYRGELPAWANEAKENILLEWNGGKTLQLPDGLRLHFLPLTTQFHFTNYKPYFFLNLLSGIAKNADGIIYFDPDIIVKGKWQSFERWIHHGVAVVHEVIRNDMPLTHPIRKEWEAIALKIGRKITHPIDSYLNGGFCGVSKQNVEFLQTWGEIMNLAFKEYNCDPKTLVNTNETYPFFIVDQDAMNIAAMCCSSPISEMGSEAMDFTHSGRFMSHATGSPKPWKKNYIAMILNGKIPTAADKLFWQNVNYPISVHKKSFISRKRMTMNFTSFIGRIYKKN